MAEFTLFEIGLILDAIDLEISTYYEKTGQQRKRYTIVDTSKVRKLKQLKTKIEKLMNNRS